ncbi:MAG: pyrroline-5-carboxylate reductase dimerization domain-containing protein [Caulobacteraceae bacterium]
MLEATGEEPSELRRQVTSPGGTTQAALDVLMGQDGLGPLMREAVAAAIRAVERAGGLARRAKVDTGFAADARLLKPLKVAGLTAVQGKSAFAMPCRCSRTGLPRPCGRTVRPPATP